MANDQVNLETTEYRLILVQPESRKVLALEAAGGHTLPSVGIPILARPAEHLRKAVRAMWGLEILVLDVLRAPDVFPCCAIAELLISDHGSGFKSVTLNQILDSELSELQRMQVISHLSDEVDCVFSRIGWIDQAIAWVESATGRTISSKAQIKQYNGGRGSSLVRFQIQDKHHYWLKGTGEPNTHEFAVTCLLAQLGRNYLPEVISSRPSWNAWLMSGEATTVSEFPGDPTTLCPWLQYAIESMAKLQMSTQGHCAELLAVGAVDQGIDVFRGHSKVLFEYIQESMSMQTSTKVSFIGKERLRELQTTFTDLCRRTEDLGLPTTIVHGDMNDSNILGGRGQCRFIDWSEAYVGNPLITLQHLLLFNRIESPETRSIADAALKDSYRDTWLGTCDPNALSSGFIYMPILAAASTLYGRGDWLTTSQRDDPRRRAYARMLARYIDHAASAPELLRALAS